MAQAAHQNGQLRVCGASGRLLRRAVPAVALLGLTLAWFAPLTVRPLLSDFALYAYIGDRLVQGDRLYRDVWDPKPPLFPLLNAAALRLFGRSRAATTCLLMVFMWLTLLGVRRLGGHYGRAWGAWGAVVCFGWAAWGLGQMCLQAEGFAAAPLVWAFALAVPGSPGRGRALAAGALLAVAAGIKSPLGIFVLPWVVVAGLGWHVLSAAAGFGLAVAAVVAWLAVQGVLGEAFYALLTFAVSWTAAKPGGLHIFCDQLPHMAGGLWPVVGACLAGAVYALGRRGRLTGVALAAGLACALTFGQKVFYHYHWLPFYLFGAVGFGGLLAALTRGRSVWRRALGVVVLAGLCLPRPADWAGSWLSFVQVVCGRQTRLDYAAQFATDYGEPPLTYAELYQLAAQIRQQTGAADYVWSFLLPPIVGFEANRPEPVRFFYPDGLFTPHPRRRQWQAEYVRDVLRRRPRFALICRDLRLPYRRPLDLMEYLKTDRELWGFFRRNYSLYRRLRGLEVYRFGGG